MIKKNKNNKGGTKMESKKELEENTNSEEFVKKIKELQKCIDNLSSENKNLKEDLNQYWMFGKPDAIKDTFGELNKKNHELENELQIIKEKLIAPSMSKKNYEIIKTILRIEKENLEEMVCIAEVENPQDENNNAFKKRIIDIEEALRELTNLI